MSRSVTGIHPEAAIAPSECLKLLRIVGRLPCARKRRSTYRLTGVRSQGAEQTFGKSAWGLYRGHADRSRIAGGGHPSRPLQYCANGYRPHLVRSRFGRIVAIGLEIDA
jgi:hypothetical protein